MSHAVSTDTAVSNDVAVSSVSPAAASSSAPCLVVPVTVGCVTKHVIKLNILSVEIFKTHYYRCGPY